MKMKMKMKNKIPKYLQEKLTYKFSPAQKFPDDIKQFMMDYSKFYNWDLTELKDIFKVMKTGLEERPKCAYEGCNEYAMFSNDRTELQTCCCRTHKMRVTSLERFGVENCRLHLETQEKMKKTNLEKYGVEYAISSKQAIEKIKQTNLERYGVEYAPLSKEVIDKQQKTNLERYGVTSTLQSKETKKKNIEKFGYEIPMHNKQVKDKQIKTSLERYGVSHYSMTEESKNKVIKTSLERFGVSNYTQSDEYKSKSISTCQRKYGVEYPMQHPEILLKSQKSAYKRKEYIWKTGEISMVQGYEPIVLKELEDAGYTYQEVLTAPKDMPYIEYIFEDKKHVYFPDFYIPKENRIIEVKSEYTLEKEWDKNQEKFKATKDLGYKFQVEVR